MIHADRTELAMCLLAKLYRVRSLARRDAMSKAELLQFPSRVEAEEWQAAWKEVQTLLADNINPNPEKKHG